MLFDDIMGNKKSESSSFVPFGGKEQRKNLCHGIRIHPDAVIGHLKLHTVIPGIDRKDNLMRFGGRISGTGVDCVFKNIYHGRMHTIEIDFKTTKSRGKVANKFDPVLLNFWFMRPGDILCKRKDFNRFSLQFPFFGIEKDIENQFADPFHHIFDNIQPLGDPFGVGLG